MVYTLHYHLIQAVVSQESQVLQASLSQDGEFHLRGDHKVDHESSRPELNLERHVPNAVHLPFVCRSHRAIHRPYLGPRGTRSAGNRLISEPVSNRQVRATFPDLNVLVNLPRLGGLTTKVNEGPDPNVKLMDASSREETAALTDLWSTLGRSDPAGRICNRPPDPRVYGDCVGVPPLQKVRSTTQGQLGPVSKDL